jgi:YfiH family protein
VIRPDWSVPESVRAFTTTREGGVSRGDYRSLNLGSHVDDDLEKVLENRRILIESLELPCEPVWLDQVHGIEVLRVDSRPSNVGPPRADAAITRQPGVVCCVLTADCLPVFLTDQSGSEVAVAHAGWRGLASGVLEATVRAFSAPAERLIAWAGPAISVAHFEVCAEVRQQLGGSESAWKPHQAGDKYYANLYQIAGERLAAVGVINYGHSQSCTFADEQSFFSYRRDGQCGRQASIIYLAE